MRDALGKEKRRKEKEEKKRWVAANFQGVGKVFRGQNLGFGVRWAWALFLSRYSFSFYIFRTKTKMNLNTNLIQNVFSFKMTI